MSQPSSGIGAILSAMLSQPANYSIAYKAKVIERGNRRVHSLKDRIDAITHGRTMPDLSDIAIGSGRRFDVAILFLDIVSFTSLPSGTFGEQERVLAILDVFMAEMMSIVSDHEGIFEKNTGDGLMAYFGTETTSAQESVRHAAEAAVMMHYITDDLINPWLKSEGYREINFRVGIDYGPVTIAKVGLPNTNSFVAIGSSANIANRLMRLIPYGGIAIGNEVYKVLNPTWQLTASPLEPKTGFVYVATQQPYPAFALNYRLHGRPPR